MLQPLFDAWGVIRDLSVAVPWAHPVDGVADFFRVDLLPRITRGAAHAWALVPLETQTSVSPGGTAVDLLEWRCAETDTDDRGFWIGRAWQGQGRMTEAVGAIQDWVFLELGVAALTLNSAVQNIASARAKEETGAVRVGRVSLEHHDGVSDPWRWRLTREAWAAFRGAHPA